ncbi:metal-dependent transcriptional regulator [Liberiplasma polymorphum]|uniref:metal-dependent transcriptional regulator n=1 Tax=Liberiplasma polymorphum TaxID=3374570 RepID=UPI003776A4F4
MFSAEEDYLKILYELSHETDSLYVKSSVLAKTFNYTMQSINEMIKRMAKKGFVEYVPYKGIKLTTLGKSEALRLIRAHRVWEVFLAEKLGLPWEALHEEAEKLEHVTSEEVLNRLYEYLGKPTHCMHGNPIPSAEGFINKNKDQSLWISKKGWFKITRVIDDKDLLSYLNDLSITINTEIFIDKKDDYAGIIYIKNDDEIHAITKQIAGSIFGLPVN